MNLGKLARFAAIRLARKMGYALRRCVIEMPPVRRRLSDLQDKLAKIVLIKRPMRFGGLVKWKAPRDMDLEWTGPRSRTFNEVIEFLDRLRVGHSIVGLGSNPKGRLGRRFDAIGIRDAPSLVAAR